MRELVLDRRGKDDVVEPLARIRREQKLREIAAWCSNRGKLGSLGLGSTLPSVRPLPKLLGEAGVALLVLCRRQLHREVEETVSIAFRVAFDEPDKLLC
jgi:hypothetical protein